MASHLTRLEARFAGGPLGHGVIIGDHLQTSLALPAGLGGTGRGASPEEMLLGALSGCYLLTLALVAEKMRMPLLASAVKAEAWIDVTDHTPRLGVIELRPELTIAGSAAEWGLRAARAAGLAEKHCMVAQALRGSTRLRVLEPVLIEAAH